jgi:hypothetical protein
LAAALVAWAAALSFTSFLGFAAAAALYLGLSVVRRAQRHLALAVALLIVAGVIYTAAVGTAPLPERPEGASALRDSLWVRQLIIREGWELAVSAGPFGWGRLVEVGILESVDNAYLLIAIQRGWIAIGLWLCVPLLLARQLAKALPRLPARALRRAALLGFCGVIGTMVAMYTVYLGGVYQSLLVVQIALTVSLSQLRRTVAVRTPAPSARTVPPRAVSA